MCMYIYVYGCLISVCVCATYMQWIWRPEKGTRSLGTGVTDGCLWMRGANQVLSKSRKCSKCLCHRAGLGSVLFLNRLCYNTEPSFAFFLLSCHYLI